MFSWWHSGFLAIHVFAGRTCSLIRSAVHRLKCYSLIQLILLHLLQKQGYIQWIIALCSPWKTLFWTKLEMIFSWITFLLVFVFHKINKRKRELEKKENNCLLSMFYLIYIITTQNWFDWSVFLNVICASCGLGELLHLQNVCCDLLCATQTSAYFIIWAASCENVFFFFGHIRTAKAQLSLRICAVLSGPSLAAKRIIGDYKMYKWRAKARVILCACAGYAFAHVKMHFFAWRAQNICSSVTFYPYSYVINAQHAGEKSADDTFIYLFIFSYFHQK